MTPHPTRVPFNLDHKAKQRASIKFRLSVEYMNYYPFMCDIANDIIYGPTNTIKDAPDITTSSDVVGTVEEGMVEVADIVIDDPMEMS